MEVRSFCTALNLGGAISSVFYGNWIGFAVSATVALLCYLLITPTEQVRIEVHTRGLDGTWTEVYEGPVSDLKVTTEAEGGK